MSVTRKQFLLGAGTAALGALAAPAVFAARRSLVHLGVGLASDHPATLKLVSAGQKIKAATNGELDVQIFPNSQLGDDLHMMANLRSGAMEMMATGDNIVSTLVPSAAIDNVGFAFKTPQIAWKALDGKVGDIVCADIEKVGLHPMRCIWDEGFRQITSSTKPVKTPEDLRGMKLRVPPSQIELSLFQALGASPVTINFAKAYTALQTHVADGQENPLGLIETQKFYQVQKYCSITNHIWVGHWVMANGRFWSGLPQEQRTLVEDTFNQQGQEERIANQQLDDTLEETLGKQGLEFLKPDPVPFQKALSASGFYKSWRAKFGDPLWTALESYTGPLA